MGIPWLFLNPMFKKADRDGWAYFLFTFSSLVIAILLQNRIQKATGWSVWLLGLLIPLFGHFLVTWGLGTLIAFKDGLPAYSGESVFDGLIKTYVILPLVGLMLTLYFLPLYVPLGALYVVILRWVTRLGGHE